jgi:dipeptidyl aminopeptidase/acylaminoacyl peptidase
MTDRRPIQIDDLLRIATVSDPQISADGTRVAYVVETLDMAANQARSAIWLVGADEGEPRQLTTGQKRDSAPRWSPDGRSLAFVSDRDGKRQLYILSLDGGDPRRLTDHPTGVAGPHWSPDGRRIAFLADGADRRGEPVPVAESDPRKRLTTIDRYRHKLDGQGFFGPARRHVWVVDVSPDGASGPTTSADRPESPPTTPGASASSPGCRQLTDGPAEANAPAWSPDGQTIAFVSDRSPERDQHYEGGALHLVDVATGAVRGLTSESGRAANPAWSPDGSQIAFVGAETADDASPADLNLYVIPAIGGEPQNLTAKLGRSVGQRPSGYLTPSPPVWAGPDGPLHYLIGTGGATHLWRVGLNGSLERLTEGAHAENEFSADSASSRFALLIADPVTPPEVHLYDAASGQLRQLTHHNAALLAELDLPRPERRLFKAPDGLEIEGWLLLPSRRNTQHPSPITRHPLVLTVHGGPHNYFGETWNVDHQLWAAQGRAVLFINPRGSGGYGEAFAGRVIADWGGGDLADQLAALDSVLADPSARIDPERLVLTGSSYGGFMTCWALTQTSRFRVGIAGACISNLLSFYGTSDIGASWGEREFGGPPSERMEWYLERSAALHADRVTTPLLLYHGEDDLRCPIEQSEQMFTALRRLGRDVELIRIPTESHGALQGSPVHRVEARRAIEAWLARHLA